MKQDALTVLGCTGSVALILMMGSSANALMTPNFGGDGNPKAEMQANPMSTVQEDAPVSSRQAVDTKLKQLAQAQFGCTCANCISRVRQMVQEGTLSL